jgi:hypothetical protein
LVVIIVAIVSRAGYLTPGAEMLLWALLAVGTGAADRLLHSESPPDSGGVAGFVGPMVLMVGAGFVAYFIARFTLGPDAATIIGPAFGGTSFILARVWVANRRQGSFVFEDTFGPDLTALTLLHVVFILLLTESVAVNYVGGVTAIIVNQVRDTAPAFNPTFIYGLTTTAFAAPAFFLGAFFVGRLTYHILHRKVWAWLGLIVLLWVLMRALLASSPAAQQELTTAQVNLRPVAILGTLLAYLVLLLLVLRLGHWSSRFVVTRRVSPSADQGPNAEPPPAPGPAPAAGQAK